MLDGGPQLGANMPAINKNRTRKNHEPDFSLDGVTLSRLKESIEATKIDVALTESLQPNPRNARKHSARQVALLVENIKAFGFTQPIIVDENNVILCGHARHTAAIMGSVSHVPIIRLSHLDATKKRALAIADNKLAELGEWDIESLVEELNVLFDPDSELSFDPRVLGFENLELDQILDEQPPTGRTDPADRVEPPNRESVPITNTNDVWSCDQHKVICANALEERTYQILMGEERAEIAFTDPPYNVPNAGHVSGRAGVREFAMAAGEMCSEQYVHFLAAFCAFTLRFALRGAIFYICMDWRHLREIQSAADPIFGPLKNLIVWVKSNAGMGSFYRSQHEFILVYGAPGGKPINNFGLGGKGRYRTNVWRYPGFNSFGRNRDAALAMHPTVKPVAMVADALMDCSNRGSIVLDPFGGSGTTMIAAERTGRRARLIEIDPLYCDVIVTRWQEYTGKTARLAETNETFEQVKLRRGANANLRGS